MSEKRHVVHGLIVETLHTSYVLFKIIIPIVFVTKLLTDNGVTAWLGNLLAPVMAVVGLPGEMGLVWATAMMTNLYGGLAVFASMPTAAHLSVAQVSVLTTMMLIAHALPLEVSIAQKAGSRFASMAILRVGSALLLGVILYHGYAASNYLQQPNQALWQPTPTLPGWEPWLYGQVENLLFIFCIIFVLLALMRLLEHFGLMSWLTQRLKPFLAILGMHQDAAPVTLIGMLLGLSYGGSLIIKEAQSGKLSAQDIFLSLALMGLCHSLIEDTLLMAVVGGHWSAILWARILFSVLMVAGIAALLRIVPTALKQRFFY
ncbi:MAG: nucleoside recognition domain-containing protein [Desulfuromonas sp.]|nr:nucleoside recognition domain-containing protein [Desulfuromonas sp.]